MMREILFKGKREYNGKWVVGSLLIWSDGSTEICHTHPDNEDELLKVIVYPETVGQFTGLYDSTKWEDLTEAEKLDFYHQHYIGEDGMSVRFQHIDDVKHLWKGKKVFEGDMFHLDDEIIAVVIFKDGCFRLEEYGLCGAWTESGFDECGGGWGVIECNPIDWYAIRDMEIIGNIHDNPELLEEGA